MLTCCLLIPLRTPLLVMSSLNTQDSASVHCCYLFESVTSLSDPCLLQLPASFFAYRKQQHRWTCGPVQLWRKAAVDIWASSLPLMSKLDLILCYFGIRKFATHWVSLGFFCTIVPLSIFTPEVTIQLQDCEYLLLCFRNLLFVLNVCLCHCSCTRACSAIFLLVRLVLASPIASMHRLHQCLLCFAHACRSLFPCGPWYICLWL